MNAPEISPGRGYALRLLAVLSIIAGFGVPIAIIVGLRASNPVVGTLVTLIIGGAFFVAAVSLTHRSRRHFAVAADDLLARDHRPPVVYLRSFYIDTATSKVDLSGTGKIMAIVGGLPIAIYQVVSEWREGSEEEWWTAELAAIGPPIAIGRPGELPFRGAARMYVTDGAWRDVVRDFGARAALVIVLGGATDGLRWEIQHLAASVPRDKLVCLLPNDPKDYEQFRDVLRTEMNVDTGDRPAVSHRMTVCAVLWFSREGTHEVVPIWGNSRINVAQALEPVLAERRRNG